MRASISAGRWAGRFLVSCILAVAAGCFDIPDDSPVSPAANTASATTNPAGTTSQPDTPSTPKQQLEPYDPPTLDELDAKADWVDQPVQDSLEVLRRKQAGETPLATAAEALALRNIDEATNAKIASALGRVATSDDEVDYEAVINRHLRGEVKSTNPIMISSVQEFDVLGLTGYGLFGSDYQLNPIATKDTVKSWQTSKDRLMDKVVLRDDVTWSDGKPITAHDVVFSFKTIMNPDVPVPAVRSGTDKLRWVHAYDDYTVVFFHKEALATNVWNLSFPVIPKHIYEESVTADPTLQTSDYHVKLEAAPVVGGPYVISKRIRGQEIVLSRRDDYFTYKGMKVRDIPYFKEIRFRIIEDPNTALLALKKGELDEMALNPEQWTTQTNGDDFYERNTKARGIEWTYFYFGWNLKSPLFEDVRVRQAMSYAYNHQEMLDRLGYGLYEAANGIYHPTAWMYPADAAPPYKQDLDKAEALLDEAGWVDSDSDGIRDKAGRKFEFSLLCANIPDRVAYCTLLKENLDQIGIVCNVKPLEFTVLTQQLMEHNFEAAFGGWGTGSDPDTSENVWGTGEARNFGQYSSPRVDELFRQGRKVFDRAERAKIYGEIHKELYADQPVTWLYFRNSFYAFNKDLRGYNFSPRGPFNYGPGFGAIYKVKAK